MFKQRRTLISSSAVSHREGSGESKQTKELGGSKNDDGIGRISDTPVNGISKCAHTRVLFECALKVHARPKPSPSGSSRCVTSAHHQRRLLGYSPPPPHQSLNREGRLGTTDDFATSFLLFFSSVLHCPLGPAELEACDVVSPILLQTEKQTKQQLGHRQTKRTSKLAN